MISKIFSLRNYVMKQIMKPNKEGIMQIPDKGKVDFGEMLIKEELFQKGIDPQAITSAKQLDNILNTPTVTPHSTPKKSGEVIDVDFDKGRWWKDPEDLAHGGRTGTGLNYLLGEDDQNSRVPYGLGGISKARRAFLKLMGAGTVGIGAAKSGLLSIFKGGGKKQVVETLTSVPIKDISGMPAWFKPLVNQVIKKGDDVSTKFATGERKIVHVSELPDSKTRIFVEQDLTTGDVVVDIGMGKHGWADGHFGQPVRLNYKASEVIEPTIKKGKVTSKGTKTKEELNVEEAEFTGGHPENVKFEESTFNKFGEHGSDFSEVEEFATGLKKGKGGSGHMASGGRVPLAGGKKALTKEQLEEMLNVKKPKHYKESPLTIPDDWLKRLKEKLSKAEGGRVPLGAGGVARKIVALLKDKKKLKAAYDDIFPTDDYKYDANIVAESLVENNPKAFGNRLYDDLNDAERMEVYGAALEEASRNFAEILKMKRAMRQASKPTKTLKGIEETGTINISDPDVASEFSRFMKETDPKGFKDLEQKVELSNLDIKGKKGHAEGGRVSLSAGGGIKKKLQTHFDNNQKLKDAVRDGLISEEEYNILGGYDATQTMGLGPATTGIGSTVYNVVQSIKGDQPWSDIPGDVARNVKGSLYVPPKLKNKYEEIVKAAQGGLAGMLGE